MGVSSPNSSSKITEKPAEVGDTDGTHNTRITRHFRTTKHCSYKCRDWSREHRVHMGLHHVFCIYTVSFNLVLLWDSWMWKWVDLWFLCFFFGLFNFSVGFSCPTLIWWFMFYLIILYFVMFCCYLLVAFYFLLRDRKGVDPNKREDREEMGEI